MKGLPLCEFIFRHLEPIDLCLRVQLSDFFQNAQTALNSIAGYLVIFLVFVENIVIIVLLAKRRRVNVRSLIILFHDIVSLHLLIQNVLR